MASIQHDNRERGTSVSLLGNRVPSKCACCFEVPDLIMNNTMPGLTNVAIAGLTGFDGRTKDEIEADQSKCFYSLPF